MTDLCLLLALQMFADLGMPGVSQPEDPRQKKKRRVDLPMIIAKLYSEEGAALVKFVGTLESVATTAKGPDCRLIYQDR